MRRESKAKKLNTRVLSGMVTASKVMHSRDRQPLTVLGTDLPTMSEKSLKRMKMSQSKRMIADFEATNGTPARSKSRLEGADWEDDLLGRYGLELTEDKQRLRPRPELKRPRAEEIAALQMSHIISGPQTSRLKKDMKEFMRSQGRSHSSMK